MATPLNHSFPITGDDFIDVMTNGYGWVTDSSNTIRWSISDGFAGETWISPATAVAELAQVFAAFSYFANVHFTYAGKFSTPVAASSSSDINISLDGENRFFSSPSTWAMGFFPNAAESTRYTGAPGDIFLNLNSMANTLPSYAPGSQGFFLALHEIGHTLGLKHTHDGGGTGRPTLADIGLSAYDSDWVSIMSYNDAFSANLTSWDPATPMILDVLAMQFLYGKNMSVNAEDNVYTLPLNNYYQTMWDAGGHDHIDLTTSSVGWDIELPNIRFSTQVDTLAGSANPLGQVPGSDSTFYWLAGTIEDAYGSAFADNLVGSDGNNILNGEGGNDTIDGGLGTDTAILNGKFADYKITKSGAIWTATDQVGSQGTDTYENIERFEFADRAFAVDDAGTGGQAYRLYQAAFNRVPDIAGLGVWIDALDHGLALTEAARRFEGSQEFIHLYGEHPSNAALVTLLYENVLHREPEPAALPFWVNILDTGQQSRELILANFSESPENQANLIGVIQNGVEYVPVA